MRALVVLCVALLALSHVASAERSLHKLRVRAGVPAAATDVAEIEGGAMADIGAGMLTQTDLDAEAADTPVVPAAAATPAATTTAAVAAATTTTPAATTPAPAPAPAPAATTTATTTTTTATTTTPAATPAAPATPAATPAAPAPAATTPATTTPAATPAPVTPATTPAATPATTPAAPVPAPTTPTTAAAAAAAAAAKAKADAAAKKKAAADAKKKIADAKKAAAAKKKAEIAAKKAAAAAAVAAKKAADKKKHNDKKKSVFMKCKKDDKTGEMACSQMERAPHGKWQKKGSKTSHSDADSGTWKQVAHNPWPPHNLDIKSWVLTGVGATNIKLKKAEGGFGHPNPSPLVLKFAIGWDSHIHKLIEQYKERPHIDGTLYYVNGDNKAVAKLTFNDAVIASIKFPKLRMTGAKSDKKAMITLVLQPTSSKVERIDKVSAAPDAPEPDMDKLHAVKSKNFKVDIDGIDTTKISKVKLPTIVMRLRRKVKYTYSAEEKKQVRNVDYKVSGIKKKHLFITVPKDAIAPWKAWQSDAHPHPRVGSVTILQPAEGSAAASKDAKKAAAPAPAPAVAAAAAPADAAAANASLQNLMTVKFTGLFINRIGERKDGSVVELTFDTMDLEHADPDF